MSEKVKIGVVGLGNMGSFHIKEIPTLETATLAAICDIDREKADRFGAQLQVPKYYDYKTMLEKADLDAVLCATPHYDHVPISIDSFARGLHVLVEKPITVHVKDGRKMVAAYEAAKKKNPKLVFSIMFQQRTNPYWRKVKEMIDTGQLGKLVRATWLITDWFRSQTYYDTGGWRATWKGEGGGVLLNQCPHNLDLYQWFFGVPKRVMGFAQIGKYHTIEVEDEVTAYFEYANGMVGHFITTTAESPGTNRLEIVGENGKLVYENGRLTFDRNKMSMIEWLQKSKTSFDRVEHAVEDVPFGNEPSGHKVVIDNFAKAILYGEKQIAAGPEGINGLSIGNAIMLSSFLGKPVEIPFDEDLYEAKLMELIAASKFQKGEIVKEDVEFNKSFQK
jgi:predicted dehydrogenase